MIVVDYFMFSLYTYFNNKSRKKQKMRDLTSGNISKNLILYAIPALFSILLNRAYSTIDVIMVGQLLGENGLAAVGCTDGFVTALASFSFGAATGISIYLGTLMSKKENESLVSAIKSNLFFIMTFAFTLSVIALLFYKPIFHILNIKNTIYKDAFYYLVAIILSNVFSAANTMINDAFCCFGNPSHALKITFISCVVNIILNYVFMKILGLGVLGAGLATFIALGVGFIANLFSINKIIRSLSSKKAKFKINKQDIFSALKLALPCMLQQFALQGSSLILQPVVNNFGESFIASYSIAMNLYNICTLCFFATSRGMSVFCTQCYGSNKMHLIKKGMLLTILYTSCLAVPIILAILIFPTFVSSLFIKDVTSDTALFVIKYIVTCFPFIIFAVGNNYFHNFFRGVLKPNYAFISTSVYAVVRIATSILLISKYGINAVYYGFIISWITEFTVCLIFFLSNKWKKRSE